MDYKQLTMNFKVEGTSHTFQGLGRTGIEALTWIIFPNNSFRAADEPKSYPSKIGQLLAKFSHVFESPTTLPPRRSHDHKIPLRAQTDECAAISIPLLPKTEIEKMYLGHIISEQGVSVDPTKIQAVIEWPTPTTAKGVRGFLGLAGYYRKFIRNFGCIASPLTRLLSKEGFHWNEAAEMAFKQLKEALTSPPILCLPDFSQPFVIECDASGLGIGAILTQQNQPVAYFSEALKGSALALSTYEKEMLAIIKAIKKWRPYLLGKPFTVRTDHKSLKRWLPKLLGYDYKIEYKRGPENQGADSLSRVVEFQFLSLSMPHADWWSILQKEIQQDSFYEKLIEKSTSQSDHKSLQHDGVWFKRDKVYLSPTSDLIPKILTLSRIKHSFVWPSMRRMVKEFLQQCDVCQRFKTDCMKPWGLPSSNGYTTIMVVVDRLTKYAHFIALKHPFTTVTVAKAFVANVVRLHGIPTSIVSDRDKVFISSFWQTLFQLQGTKLCMGSSYHPQSDGQTEVVNRTLEQYLRLVYDILPPRLGLCTALPCPSVDEYLRDRDAILRELRYNLLQAQNRMKCQADQHRRDASFAVGDYVYLKLQPYRQTSVAFQGSMKLAPRFFGPYQVIEKVGSVAYKLALPPGSQIHNVFHVSLLRRHLGSITPTSTQLPLKGKYRPKSEILVKWVGAPAADATWENEWRFTKSYPDFILVDKDP
ncbi:hypothetical protein AAG906_020920 [Vitis piasezkii]